VPLTNTAAVRENRPLPPPPNSLFRKDFMERLNRELDLSPEQREHIEKIVGEGQDRTRELWRVEWIETRQQIRKELGPKQQAQFEELFKSRPREKLRSNPAHQGLLTNAALPAVSSNTPAYNP
jgi:Spy/CpxP family protein refolding chaperone